MPFEPRIHNHDDTGEINARLGGPADPVWNDAELLNLPDDLAMLADQLRDDAHYLAQKHPADATSEERELAWKEFVESKSTTPRYAFPGRWVSTAAALVAVFTLGGWAIYFSQTDDGQDRAFVAGESSVRPSSTPRVSVSEVLDEINGVDEVGLVEPSATEPRLIPASFLEDVSGPELDGMLDLLEEDESGLSI